MKNPRSFLLPFAVVAVGLLVACGGDKKDSSSAAGQGGSGSGGASSSQALDLSKSADKLAQLKSFRFDMTMKLDLSGSFGAPSGSSSNSSEDAFGGALLAALFGGLGDIKAEGAFIAPDQSDLKVKLAGQEIGIVQIGKKSWVKFGDKWQVADESDSGFSFRNGTPGDMFRDMLPGEVLKGGKTSKETVNGVKTTRYSFDKKTLGDLAKDLGESTGSLSDLETANLDVWLNDDSIPVKVVMSVKGKDEKGQKVGMDVQMNVKDINGNFQIKAPI